MRENRTRDHLRVLLPWSHAWSAALLLTGTYHLHPKHPVDRHFGLLGDDWGPYCCMDTDGGFSQSHPGFSILNLFFFISQAMFYSFTELHNKNHYDQTNPRNKSHTSNKIYMGHIQQEILVNYSFAWLHSCKYRYVHNQYLPGLWKIRKTITITAWLFLLYS